MDYNYALAYAAVPLVFYCLPLCFYRYLVRGYPLSKKSAIITVLVYGFIFALVFSLIMSAIVGETVTPAFTSFTAFFGLISYFMLSRGSSHRQTEDSPHKEVKTAEECSQENNGNGTVPEEPTVTDPLPEESNDTEQEDKPAAKEHKTLTLKASSSDKEKVILNLKIPSARTLKILNIVVIVILTVAVIALSIALPLSLKSTKKASYDRGYNDGCGIGYAHGEYNQKYFGLDTKYEEGYEDGYNAALDTEHSETYEERKARIKSEYQIPSETEHSETYGN